MAFIVRAIFDGKVFVPDQPVELTVGQKVDVTVIEETAVPSSHPRLTLGKYLEKLPGDAELPADAAAQHDHYVYGTPRRETP